MKQVKKNKQRLLIRNGQLMVIENTYGLQKGTDYLETEKEKVEIISIQKSVQMLKKARQARSWDRLLEHIKW